MVVEDVTFCGDVVAFRDTEFGVPHIYGQTREAAQCANGYLTAADRLFLMDVLRHVGRARMSELLGASPANQAMDRSQLMVAPYTDEDHAQQRRDLCESTDPLDRQHRVHPGDRQDPPAGRRPSTRSAGWGRSTRSCWAEPRRWLMRWSGSSRPWT